MSNVLPLSSPDTGQMMVNGVLVPFDQATVHLMSPAMRYGLNVFEGLRAYWNPDDQQLYIFRLADHMARFAQSMKLMRFAPDFGVDQVAAAIIELLRADGHRANCHIRATAYLDGLGEHHVPGPVSWGVFAGPRPRSRNTETGVRVQVSSWRRMSDNALSPRVKCGANYANARLARFQARLDGYDDAVILNEQGKIAEGPGACLFIVRSQTLITPDVTSGILESVTRDTVLALARAAGVPVQERPVDRTELAAAHEAFFAGSAAEILPVTAVDGIELGSAMPGPLTRDLQSAYYAAVEGRAQLDKAWLTAVYA